MIVFIDTVANRNWEWRLKDDAPHQPYLIRFCSMGIMDIGSRQYTGLCLQPPPEERLDEQAQERMGLTDGPFGDVPGHEPTEDDLITITRAISKATLVVAHSAAFHRKLLRSFYGRHGEEMPVLEWFCTMTNSADICAIPPPSGRGKSKWPTLEEAYAHFAGHDAVPDSGYATEDVHQALTIGMGNVERVRTIYAGILHHRRGGAGA